LRSIFSPQWPASTCSLAKGETFPTFQKFNQGPSTAESVPSGTSRPEGFVALALDSRARHKSVVTNPVTESDAIVDINAKIKSDVTRLLCCRCDGKEAKQSGNDDSEVEVKDGAGYSAKRTSTQCTIGPALVLKVFVSVT